LRSCSASADDDAVRVVTDEDSAQSVALGDRSRGIHAEVVADDRRSAALDGDPVLVEVDDHEPTHGARCGAVDNQARRDEVVSVQCDDRSSRESRLRRPIDHHRVGDVGECRHDGDRLRAAAADVEVDLVCARVRVRRGDGLPQRARTRIGVRDDGCNCSREAVVGHMLNDGGYSTSEKDCPECRHPSERHTVTGETKSDYEKKYGDKPI